MAGTRGTGGLSGWLGVVLDSPEPVRLARFYGDLLGWDVSADDPAFVTAVMPGHPVNLAFQLEPDYRRPVWPSTPAEQQMSLHLDIGVTDLEATVSGALGLGATLADFQPQDDVRVLLDPDGHPFCLYVDEDPPPG